MRWPAQHCSWMRGGVKASPEQLGCRLDAPRRTGISANLQVLQMPILRYHLIENQYTDEQCEELLIESSHLYASVLNSPIERVRVFINRYSPQMVAVGGISVGKGAVPAPYFEFLVLAGRPLEQRQRLLAGFTDLIEGILGVDRRVIRGACREIPAEDWGIGGVPASNLREREIRAREELSD